MYLACNVGGWNWQSDAIRGAAVMIHICCQCSLVLFEKQTLKWTKLLRWSCLLAFSFPKAWNNFQWKEITVIVKAKNSQHCTMIPCAFSRNHIIIHNCFWFSNLVWSMFLCMYVLLCVNCIISCWSLIVSWQMN